MKTSRTYNSVLELKNVAELLQLAGIEFIDAAYECVLGRNADADGQGYYLYRLQTGFSKMGILAQMRSSSEGSGKKLLLPGLEAGLQQYTKRRLGFWAKLSALIGLPLDDSPADRRMRALANQITLVNQDIAAQRHDSDDLLVALSRKLGESNDSAGNPRAESRMPDREDPVSTIPVPQAESNIGAEIVSRRRTKMILERIKVAAATTQGRSL